MPLYLISVELTNHSGLQVHKDSPWNMLATTSLAEEGIEGVIADPNGFIWWHLAIRLDAMLQAVKLPAGITHLDSCLAHMDADALTLQKEASTIMA